MAVIEWRRSRVPASSWALVVLRNAVHDGAAYPKVRVIAVQSLCWFLVVADFFDGMGLAVGGDRLARTSTYDVLRQIPGGMRTYGVLLLLGSITLAWGIGQGSYTRQSARWLQLILSLGVGYYTLWAVCIPLAWWHAHQVPAAWPALSKYVLMGALYFVCARAVAPPRRRR